MDTTLQRIEDLKFDSFFDSQIKAPENLKLRGIKAVKIYHCTYGRNAWHSTWAHRYQPGCMHGSIESAKRFAEENRVQGSIFYIDELPALLLDGGSYSVLVTQINHKCPLREYSAKARSDFVALNSKKIEGYRDNYLTFGSPLNGAILSFDYDSRFWKTQQPRSNSLILMYSKKQIDFLELKTTKLKAWISKSEGKDRYLSWKPLKSKISQSSVLRIYNQSGFNPKKKL